MLSLGSLSVQSRLILGTAGYPSLSVLEGAIRASEAALVTVSVRRHGQGEAFWNGIQKLGVPVLPNTAGCASVQEACLTARLAREVFGTNRIKLEITRADMDLQPDPLALVQAAEQLCKDGFEVFPYTTDDLVVAEHLIRVGCPVLMPGGAPIGSGQGLQTPEKIQRMKAQFPNTPILIDAGLGRPSHAAEAMELGVDGILLNTAIAQAGDPIAMANAFRLAVGAGRQAYEAGWLAPRSHAVTSTPESGKASWHFDDETVTWGSL